MKDTEPNYIIIIGLVILLFIVFIYKYEKHHRQELIMQQNEATQAAIKHQEKMIQQRIKEEETMEKVLKAAKGDKSALDTPEAKETYEKLFVPVGELEGAPSVYTTKW